LKLYRHIKKRWWKKRCTRYNGNTAPGTYEKYIARWLTLTPGDLVHDCDGFNHRIVEITTFWGTYRPIGRKGKGKFLCDVSIVVEDDNYACSCGWGAGKTPGTKAEIEAYWRMPTTPLGWENLDNARAHYKAILDRGDELVDADGCLLPHNKWTPKERNG